MLMPALSGYKWAFCVTEHGDDGGGRCLLGIQTQGHMQDKYVCMCERTLTIVICIHVATVARPLAKVQKLVFLLYSCRHCWSQAKVQKLVCLFPRSFATNANKSRVLSKKLGFWNLVVPVSQALACGKCENGPSQTN